MRARVGISSPVNATRELAIVDGRLGWRIVVAVFFTVGVLLGSAYAIGTMTVELQSAFSMSREQVGVVLGLALAGIYYAAPVGGYLAELLGTRISVFLGMALMTASLVAASVAREKWHLVLTLGLGVGTAIGVAYTPCVTAVNSWFKAKRGLAMGIAATGMGAGTFMGSVLVAHVSATSGWRQALVALAVCCGVVTVVFALRVTRMEEWNGNCTIATTSREGAESLWSLVVNRCFLMLAGSSLLVSFAFLTPMAHLAASAIDRGIDGKTAATIVGIAGAASVPARILIGHLADKFGRTRTLAWCYAGLGASFALWYIAQKPIVMMAFATAYGIFYGSSVVLRPAALADHFSGPRLGVLMGLFYFLPAFGALGGPWVFGQIRDATGTYETAILLSIALCILSAVMVARVKARDLLLEPPSKVAAAVQTTATHLASPPAPSAVHLQSRFARAGTAATCYFSYLAALALLVVFQVAGEAIGRAFELKFPGALLGMLLLLAVLTITRGAGQRLTAVSLRLAQLIGLMVLPAGAAIGAVASTLGTDLMGIAVSLVISTLLGIAVTGITANFMSSETARRHAVSHRDAVSADRDDRASAALSPAGPAWIEDRPVRREDVESIFLKPEPHDLNYDTPDRPYT